MLQIKFKNIDKSDLIHESVHQRLQSLVEKFPPLERGQINVTLEMENSPLQAGPDLFKVKLHVIRGRYDGVFVEKSNANLYVALAEVVDLMLEKLNRMGDKKRVKNRKEARSLRVKVEQMI